VLAGRPPASTKGHFYWLKVAGGCLARQQKPVLAARTNRFWPSATTVQMIVRYIRVWDLLLDFTLTETADRFIWKWTASGEFSSTSAYRALLFGRSSLLGASHPWKTQAPGRVRFFGWLVLHGRCWTSDRLRRHGLSDRDVLRSLCTGGRDFGSPTSPCCVHIRETWFRVLWFFSMADFAPLAEGADCGLVVEQAEGGRRAFL
jgi:hypothetical protein